MPNYRRAFNSGGCWFFTVNLLDRRRRLLVEHIDKLHAAVAETQARFPFNIDAMVIRPDHLHAVWTLPDGDADFSVRWSRIKARFSRGIPEGEPLTASRRKRGERGIWQRRYWEHAIRDERDFGHHVDYCWFNPVKHGLVSRVEDWPYSTLHRDMQILPPTDLTAFEAALAKHAKAARLAGYGEPE
jgi:putative transposase